MLGFESLPSEILLEIVSLLDTPSLKALRRTARAFYEPTTPPLFRSITFDFGRLHHAFLRKDEVPQDPTASVFSPATAPHIKRIKFDLATALLASPHNWIRHYDDTSVARSLAAVFGPGLQAEEVVLHLERNPSSCADEPGQRRLRVVSEVCRYFATTPSRPTFSLIVADLSSAHTVDNAAIFTKVLPALTEMTHVKLLSLSSMSSALTVDAQYLLSELCPAELVVRMVHPLDTFYAQLPYEKLRSLDLMLDITWYSWTRPKDIDDILLNAMPHLESLRLNVMAGKKLWLAPPVLAAPKLRFLQLGGDEGKAFEKWGLPALEDLHLVEVTQDDRLVEILQNRIRRGELPELKKVMFQTLFNVPPTVVMLDTAQVCKDARISFRYKSPEKKPR